MQTWDPSLYTKFKMGPVQEEKEKWRPWQLLMFRDWDNYKWFPVCCWGSSIKGLVFYAVLCMAMLNVYHSRQLDSLFLRFAESRTVALPAPEQAMVWWLWSVHIFVFLHATSCCVCHQLQIFRSHTEGLLWLLCIFWKNDVCLGIQILLFWRVLPRTGVVRELDKEP